MTQEKKVQTAAVMDVTGVERAAQDAVRSVRTMAEGITREGEKAGKGMDAIGDGVDRADRAIEAKSRSMSDRLSRLTRQAQRDIAALAATSNGGAGSAAAFEYEAALRGSDVSKLQPRIAVLRDLQTQANSLADSMRQAMVGEEFIASINQRVTALQRQSSALKSSEADMLALRAAELGLTQQADPLIAKLRGVSAALNEAQAASRKTAAGDSFLTGLSAQANAIGKTRADLLELKAAELGVSAQAASMIAAVRAADGEMMGLGKNAKLTANALRLVPAQFTDIVVSLQAGQSPMQVFLQQGGQLKDMFGGVGEAARALGSYVLGLINPFTVAAAAAAAFGAAFLAGAAEAAKFQRTLILSGQQAGVTAGQLSGMARAIRDLGAGTQGRAAEVLSLLAESADVGAGNLQRFVAAALQLEKVGGPAAEKTAEAFRSLAKDPLQAALKLNEGTNFLTRSTYEQIRALEQQGRTVEAARVAQEAYAATIESRTPQLVGTLGFLERAWNAVAGATKQAWDAAKGVGRADTLQQQLEAVGQQIAAARQRIADAGKSDVKQAGLGFADRELKALQDQQSLLQEQARLEQRGAESAANQLATIKLKADFDKDGLALLDSAQRKRKELDRVQREGLQLVNAGLITEEQLRERIGAIQAKYADKTGISRSTFKAEDEAARAYIRAMGGLQDIQQQATASGEGLSKTQAKLRDIQADPAWANYSRQQREQILTEGAAAQAAEDHAAAVKTAARVAVEAGREYQQWLNAMERSGDAVAKQVQALQDEDAAARIAATGRLSLKAAIEEVTIARLRDAQVAAMGNPDAVAALQREIEEREKLRDLLQGQEVRKQAEDATKEWNKASEKIGDSITDALMRGFESGKGFAAALRDTVVNMFKTMVLRPVVQAIVSPVAAGIGQVLGLPGTPGGGGSAGGLGGGIGDIAGRVGLGKIGAPASGVLSQLGMLATVFTVGNAIGNAISGGYTTGGWIGNNLGGLIGGVPGGVINRLFGRKLTQSGIEGEFSADGFDGNAFQFLKGGLFRSDKTKRSPLDDATGAAFDAAAQSIGASTRAYAEALGLPVAAVDGFTQRIKLNLKGLDEAGQKAAIDKAFAGFADGIAARFTAALSGLTKAGETASQTLQRVAEALLNVNRVRAGLGQSALSSTAASGGIASALVDEFGGADALSSAADAYLRAVYTEAERAAIGARQLQTELAKQGVAVPATREAYRALVDAQDLATDSGRKLYAALLQLAPTFAQVTEAAAQANLGLQAEIDRLRSAGQSANPAQVLAQFAAATAQARAGDAAARQQLPALSQAVEQAAQITATTAADVARVRAWLASSLAQTIGEAVAPGFRPSSTGAAMASNSTDMVAQQLGALTDRIAALEAPMQASAVASARTNRLLERVMPDGDALSVRVTP